jgi:hypothetical protein
MEGNPGWRLGTPRPRMRAVEAQRCVCADSDDALDAVIAALTSRAAALSKTSTR